MIQTKMRDHGAQIGSRIVNFLLREGFDTQVSVLHHVFGIRDAAEHPIRDREKERTVRFKIHCSPRPALNACARLRCAALRQPLGQRRRVGLGFILRRKVAGLLKQGYARLRDHAFPLFEEAGLVAMVLDSIKKQKRCGTKLREVSSEGFEERDLRAKSIEQTPQMAPRVGLLIRPKDGGTLRLAESTRAAPNARRQSGQEV